MSARRALAALALVAGAACADAAAPPADASRVLRVCADPNNLPYSNRAGEGFENAVMALLARDLGARVETTWWAQRRGALRNTLDARDCDIVPGIANDIDRLATTRALYRASYVFVARRGGPWADVASFDDPRLAQARIGVQLVGDDGANTPPVHALARRGLAANLRGFMIYGNYGDPAPQAAIVESVARGEVDLAVAWGPTAGYFAQRSATPLALTPVTPWLDGPQWPMVFGISIGVRREDRALRRDLDRAIARNRAAIDTLLDRYGVPRLPLEATDAAGADPASDR